MGSPQPCTFKTPRLLALTAKCVFPPMPCALASINPLDLMSVQVSLPAPHSLGQRYALFPLGVLYQRGNGTPATCRAQSPLCEKASGRFLICREDHPNSSCFLNPGMKVRAPQSLKNAKFSSNGSLALRQDLSWAYRQANSVF